MYTTAQIVQGVVPNAYLIPQAAITRLPTGQAVAMLVNAKGVVESRPVETSGVQGQNWIVTNGLKPAIKSLLMVLPKLKKGKKYQQNLIKLNQQTLKVQHQMLRNRLNQVNLKQNRKQLQMHKG